MSFILVRLPLCIKSTLRKWLSTCLQFWLAILIWFDATIPQQPGFKGVWTRPTHFPVHDANGEAQHESGVIAEGYPFFCPGVELYVFQFCGYIIWPIRYQHSRARSFTTTSLSVTVATATDDSWKLLPIMASRRNGLEGHWKMGVFPGFFYHTSTALNYVVFFDTTIEVLGPIKLRLHVSFSSWM